MYNQSELQWRSSKVLEKHFLKSVLLVENLYQASTTIGLDQVSSSPPQTKKLLFSMWIGVLINQKSSNKIMDPLSSSPAPQSLDKGI